MSNQLQAIRTMVLIEPLPNKQDELVAWLRELYALMEAKKYSSDMLYRDVRHGNRFVHMRVWCSEEARTQAQHDPDVHRYWMKLPELCKIEVLFEELEPLINTNK